MQSTDEGRTYDVEDLRRVAAYQRRLNLSVLGYFGLVALGLTVTGATDAACLIGIVGLGVLLVSMIATVQLANALHGPGMAALCVLLMFIPFAGLAAMLVLSINARTRLANAGVPVGLLGASPEDVHLADEHRAPFEGPQLAGMTCAYCQQKIHTHADGALCKTCKAPVHRDCRKDHRVESHARPTKGVFR